LSNPTKVVFTLPTTNTDGSVLAVSDVTGIKINVLNANNEVGFSTVVAVADLGLDANGSGSIPLPSLPGGSYTVVLYTESVSAGVAVESAASEAIPFSLAFPSIPNPPVAVSVA
jgi:hypothetical protein